MLEVPQREAGSDERVGERLPVWVQVVVATLGLVLLVGPTAAIILSI